MTSDNVVQRSAERRRAIGRASGARSRAAAEARKLQAFAAVDWPRVLDRIRSGERARIFCDGRDGMPTVKHYWAYVRTHPEYRAEVDAAQEGRRGAKPTAAKMGRYLEAAEATSPTEALAQVGVTYSSIKRLLRIDEGFGARYRASSPPARRQP